MCNWISLASHVCLFLLLRWQAGSCEEGNVTVLDVLTRGAWWRSTISWTIPSETTCLGCLDKTWACENQGQEEWMAQKWHQLLLHFPMLCMCGLWVVWCGHIQQEHQRGSFQSKGLGHTWFCGKSLGLYGQDGQEGRPDLQREEFDHGFHARARWPSAPSAGHAGMVAELKRPFVGPISYVNMYTKTGHIWSW